MLQLYSRKDASAMLGISISTLGRLIARGELDAYRVGGQVRGYVRVSEDAINRYLNGNKITKENSNVSTDDSNA